MVDFNKRAFCHFTLKDILSIISSVAIPIALAIYTAIGSQQQKQQAEKKQQFDFEQSKDLRQQTLYDEFLNNIYKLDKDGYLNDSKNPWAFANAYYRAAHRQWDTIRKGDIIQFLKEEQLIGRNNCSNGCRTTELDDIIRLNELNFDKVHLASETGVLNKLNLQCVSFDQVSMSNAEFSSVSLNGVSFDGGRLNNAKFDSSSLLCASFNGVNLSGADFGNSDLTGAHFSNSDLSGAKLTEEQIKQASFHNVTMPNGKKSKTASSTTTKKRIAQTTTIMKTKMSTTSSSISTTKTITTSSSSTSTSTSIPSSSTTSSTTSSTSTSTTSKTTTTSPTTAATAQLSLSGVQLNLDPLSLSSGWSLCYNGTYADSLVSTVVATVLAACNKNKLLLGCRPVANTKLSVAAMGNRADVLYDCGSTSTCTHVANGVGWYFSSSYSWGFVYGSGTVKRNTCDQATGDDAYRLCWHTSDVGGYRCGSTLCSTDSTWAKVIYHAN